MGRSGYSDDLDAWDLIRWRGAVASAIRGKRGQAFLREMRQALDVLPEKRLVQSVLVSDEGCCAMGAVAKLREADTTNVDPFERDEVADFFGIAEALAAEIAFENDDDPYRDGVTPEQRWQRMRMWVDARIK